MIDSQNVEDAVDLARLLGTRQVIDAVHAGFVRATAPDEQLTEQTLVDVTDELNDDVIKSFLAFLDTRDYVNRRTHPIDLRYDACIGLLINARRAREILDTAASNTVSQSFDLVCTLPSRDPSFATYDPVDFGMRQITSQLLSLCREADDFIYLVSPYLEVRGIDWLVPGLEGALERGVDVTLISRELEQGEPNNRAIETLVDIATGLDGELAVYDYYEPDPDSDRPLYTLHAKVLLADAQTAYLGSANFTNYGFSENLEIGVVVEGKDVTELMDLLRHLVNNNATEVQVTR